MEMLRAVITEARSYPELGRRLARTGPGRAVELLCQELSRAVDTGEVDIDREEIPATAELLVDMVVGNAIPGLLDPDRILRDPDHLAARRDRALEIFLNGVRPRQA